MYYPKYWKGENIMKKLSVLIALLLCVTIGGVYATWTYTQTTDVADEAINMAMNLTSVAYSDGYGVYEIDQSGLTLTIDPKEGTTHTTSLVISGQLVVTFKPATYAPGDVKENAVPTEYTISLSNNSWTYDDDETDEEAPKAILTLNHTGAHDVEWVKQADGSFTFVLNADELAEHLSLTEFDLDTKAKYDSYNKALANGQIIFAVTDGNTSSAASN